MATNDKYDRQLRLWGSNGQSSLMKSNILLINSNAVGTETLKNLILPGVGNFTVLDNEIVKEKDLGSNFFLDKSSIGQPRALATLKLLQELNPDVKGRGHVVAISSILLTDPNYLQQFNLIIAANLVEPTLVLLATICNAYSIPLVIVRSYGLIGYCRVQLANHDIVESRPEGDTIDLSLRYPFPTLIEFCEKFSFLQHLSSPVVQSPSANVTAPVNVDHVAAGAGMDTLLHSHIPYPVILYHAMIVWRTQQQHQMLNSSSQSAVVPRTSQEKEQFKSIIRSMSWDFNNEMNFQEAVKESHRAWMDTSINNPAGNDDDDAWQMVQNQRDKLITYSYTPAPPTLNNSYTDNNHDNVNDNVNVTPSAQSLCQQQQFFNCLVRTLQKFLETNHINSPTMINTQTQSQLGQYPVVGNLPDMTATTEYFTSLHKIYHTKAQQDLQTFTELLVHTLTHDTACLLSQEQATQTVTLKKEEIDTFCRNARFIKQISTRTLAEERAGGSTGDHLLMQALSDDELYSDDPIQTPIFYYIALRAVDAFYCHHQRYPGVSSATATGTSVEGMNITPIPSGTTSPVHSIHNSHNNNSHQHHHHLTNIASVADNNSNSHSNREDDAHEVWVEMNALLKKCSIKSSSSTSLMTTTATTTAVVPDNQCNMMIDNININNKNNVLQDESNCDEITPTEAVVSISRQYADEITRYRGEECHNISAVMGGIAAQEIVKVLTNQYMCINNTVVYNGVSGVVAVYEL